MPSDAIDLLFDWQDEKETSVSEREGRPAIRRKRPQMLPRPWPPREITADELARGTTQKCRQCRNTYPETVEFFMPEKRSKNGVRGSRCRGCCRKRRREQERENGHSFRRRVGRYRTSAKRRKIEWGFDDLESLREYLDTPCHYCGGNVSTRLALDRVDSAEGYFPGNVVQCCWKCNTMKSTHSVDEWVDHMERVLSHLQAGQNPPDETS